MLGWAVGSCAPCAAGLAWVGRYFADQLWSKREEMATEGCRGRWWEWGTRTAQVGACQPLRDPGLLAHA